MTDDAVLVEIARAVGAVEGTVKEMDRKNDLDHKDIKETLKAGAARFEEIEKKCAQSDLRIAYVEKEIEKVHTISTITNWVVNHPQLTVFVTAVFIALVSGSSIYEVLKR